MVCYVLSQYGVILLYLCTLYLSFYTLYEKKDVGSRENKEWVDFFSKKPTFVHFSFEKIPVRFEANLSHPFIILMNSENK